MKIIRYIFIGCILLVAVGTTVAQTETNTYEVTFRSEDQSMWKSEDYELDLDVELFDVNWDQSGGFDGIKSLVGKDFGVAFNAFTRGDMGMDFYLKDLTSGTIDEVVYPVEIDFTVPETKTFKAGEVITIESDFTIDPSATMSTVFPNGGRIGSSVNFDMENNISVTGCAWSCGTASTGSLMNVTEDMDLFQISSKPGETFYPGMKKPDGLDFACYTPPSVVPYIKYEDNLPVNLGNTDFFSGTLDLPDVTIDDFDRNPDNSLTGKGDSHYISTGIDVTRTLLSFSPHKLENTISPPVIGCAAGLRYKIMSAEVLFDATNHQEFKFEPSIEARIELPARVDYRVLDGNKTVKTGNSDNIAYQVGHKLEIKFPCNFEYIDIQPEFTLSNKFTNHTYDTYDVSLQMEALEFGIEFEKITVVPEVEVCIPNPFGDDKCATTPEVAFDPPDLSMGPLWSRTFDIGSFQRDWHKDTWELDGFQVLRPDEVFRVEPERFNVDLAASDVSCHGAREGRIELNTNGENVEYEWSDGSNGQNLENAAAGDYYVKVIDGNGCEVIENARISQPSKLEVEYTTEDCQCYGDETGQINLAVAGGTGEYSYEWSNGQTTRNLSDIPAGEYEVIVTDEAGCSVTENMKIEQPTPVVAEITDSGGPLCFGDEGGYVKTSVHGGTEPYRYEWNNGASSSNLKDLGPGEYALTVTDDKGCSSEVSVDITGPEELTGVLSIEEEISCYNGDDGAVGLELSGGVGPYEIKWYGDGKSFSEASSSLSGLESGLYRAVVQDANGCSWKDSVRLTAPSDPFFVELTEYHLSCHDGDDGAIDVDVHNGTAPYNFNWSNGLKTRDASGLTAGKHAVSVTDAKGCEAEASTVLLEPQKVTAETLINTPSCKDADDGSAEIVLSGGNPPYSVEWSNGTSGNTIEELNSGFYTARVTDNNLCVREFEVEIPLTDKACVDIPTAFTPNGDGINDTWEIRGIEYYPEYTIKVFSKWGDLIYSASAGDASWDGTFKGEKLQAASYYYVIDLGDGSSPFKGLVTIIR